MASIKDLGGGKYRVFLCKTLPDKTLDRMSKVITAKSPADAKRQAEVLEVDFRRRVKAEDKDKQVEVVTFSDVIEKWRRLEKSKLAPKTAERYEGMIENSIIPRFGGKDITTINAVDIEEYIASLSGDKVRKDKKPGGYSQKTIKAHYMLLQHLFACALRWDYISASPFAKLTAPHVDKHEAGYLDEAQINKMLNKLKEECEKAEEVNKQSPYYLYRLGMFEEERNLLLRKFNAHMHEIYVWLALTTGGRRSEITGLKWSDIDMENNTITFRRTLHYSQERGIYERNVLKNGAAAKVASLNVLVAKKLEQYRELQNEVFEKMEWENGGWLFISIRERENHEGGGPICPDVMSQWFSQFVTKCGIENVTLHGLRHSCISFLLNTGVPVEVAASIAGHNPTVTREIYEHIYPEAKRQGVAMFNRLFEGRV